EGGAGGGGGGRKEPRLLGGRDPAEKQLSAELATVREAPEELLQEELRASISGRRRQPIHHPRGQRLRRAGEAADPALSALGQERGISAEQLVATIPAERHDDRAAGGGGPPGGA